jgi:hypothetical protein
MFCRADHPAALRRCRDIGHFARLLARRPEGIFVAPFEQGEIGPDLFRAACNMGLDGLVSKRWDRPYCAGRSPHWVKVIRGNFLPKAAVERIVPSTTP